MSSALAVARRPEVPEPGQVVEVRGSTWAVSNVRCQGLPRSSADERSPGLSHVVDLQSLEEGRLSEQLAVIWELEVGHTVTPAQGLPEQINPNTFDDPNHLAAFVDPKRYQAPFWSGINIEAYQLEPLRRALQAPRTNLLLADDVGLGKTIEAGLVIQELLLRHRARTAIVVCPPSLSLKWQDEMREKFGLEFTIVNSELMAKVRRSHGLHANPFLMYPRVIVSMAWLPQARAQRLMRSVYSQTDNPKSAKQFAFDILIVDEAHHVAPSSPAATSRGRGYAVDTQRTVAVRRLADRCEHRLFLSATPHNGHPESFTALLEMIDSQRFKRGAQLDSRALKDVTVRRLKRELGARGFKSRKVQTLRFTPRDDEQAMFKLLNRIVTDSAKLNDNKASGDIVTMLLKKRFLSSPYAFGMTLRHYRSARDGRGLTDNSYDELFGERQADDEEGLWEQFESQRLRDSKKSNPLRGAKSGELGTLANWGLDYESSPDSRLDKLIEFLDGVCRSEGSDCSNERVVVFTEYAHTVEWLERVLRQQGYAGVLAVIQGSTDPETRELIRARFTEDPAKEPVRVLLATDAAGEGIDLQTHCCRLVNFDIPFNPSRLEQRIGRIDRYGQTREPQVFHFAPTHTASTYTADADFMARIARKVANVEQDLGSANQVLGEEIQRHFGSHTNATRKARRVDPNEVINDALAGGIKLNAQLTRLEQGFDASRRQMHLDPFNLRRVVDTALHLDHQLPLIATEYDADDVHGEGEAVKIFGVRPWSGRWQDTLKGLATRLQLEIPRPITFDPAVAHGRSDVVYAHLGHPIVQRSQRMLRSFLWSSASPLNRLTAVVVEGLPESFVAAVTRMALVGRGAIRLHEEIFLAGVRLGGRGTRVMAEAKAEAALDRALDAPRLQLADQALIDQLCNMWNQPGSALRSQVETSMERRAERRHSKVLQELEDRKRSDAERARGVFKHFRLNLEESIEQLTRDLLDAETTLFSIDAADQHRQRRRDIESMHGRLEQLDEEETRELAAIADRYAEVKPHTSAAALVFALTPTDAQAWAN